MASQQETYGFRAIKSASPVVKSFLAGSLSGTCSTLMFQPLDLIKTRVQQVRGFERSTVEVTKDVLGKGSLFGLWQGLYPSLVRTVPGVGIYFSCMHSMKSNLFHGQPSSKQTLFIGASSRAIAVSIMIPITVIKIRCESGRYEYKSIFGAIRSIRRSEGVRGLMVGLTPTLIRDVPFSGIYLMIYDALKLQTGDKAGGMTKFNCSIAAGILASLLTQPADVVKTRLQLGKENLNARSAIHSILVNDGVKGLFRGCLLRTLRRTLMASLAWTVYEQVVVNLGLR